MKLKIFIYLLILLFANNLLDSENAIDYYNKGKAAYFEEKYDDAINFYKKSLELNPNYFDSYVDLSHIYYDLDLYDYAYKYINIAAKLNTGTKNLLIFNADIETKLGLYDSAEKNYLEILKNDVLNVNAQNGLANLYLLNSKNSLAKNLLDNALKTDPNNFNAIYLTAKYYENISNSNNAEKYYLQNIEKNSLNPDSFFYYSLFNFKNNNIASAIDNIKTAISLKNRINYKKYYGKYLLYANNSKDALSIFTEILKIEKDNYLNYYNLGNAYYNLSDFDNASKSLDMALKLRDDDEISAYLLNNIIIDKFDTDNKLRKDKSDIFYAKAIKAKNESQFDLYLFFIKESIRLYPKNVKSRIELASYFLTQNLPERYLRELQLAYKYSNDKNLMERIQVERKRTTYKLGDDWNVDQYLVKNDLFTIPLFIIKDINNTHFNIENTFAAVFKNIFLQNIKYDLMIMDDKEYSNSEKMAKSRDNNSPFYVNLKINEYGPNVEAKIILINSTNNEVIRQFSSIKNGNDKILKLAYNLQNKLNDTIMLRSHIIKIGNNKALINSGRQSGIKLNDNFIVLKNKFYPIEFDRATYIFNQDDIKGYGKAVKVDENITELNLQENNFFKDIDIDDIIIYKK